jgi:hypothetical protein
LFTYAFFLVDSFQDKGNVCLALLNGKEINLGSTMIIGGIDELLHSLAFEFPRYLIQGHL